MFLFLCNVYIIKHKEKFLQIKIDCELEVFDINKKYSKNIVKSLLMSQKGVRIILLYIFVLEEAKLRA